ncbi:MAG: hypothetical protein RR705_11295, partial [Lachnospiraceae bacterium]
MLKTIVDSYVVFYVMGAIGVVGILSKFISNLTLRKVLKASRNMAKSNHPLMRLVRAKFEHACMVSEKVENIGAFADKYIYEYHALGFRLHTWKQLEKQTIWLSGIVAAAGAGASYTVYGVSKPFVLYGIVGVMEMAFLFMSYQTTDEKYKSNAIKTYMVDYLENVCAHKYAKLYGKEGQAKVDSIKELKPVYLKPAEMELEQLKTREKISPAEYLKPDTENTELKIKELEVKEPEIKQPEIQEPEIKEPEIKQPEIQEPEMNQ